jgi:hypothetical protein
MVNFNIVTSMRPPGHVYTIIFMSLSGKLSSALSFLHEKKLTLR